VCERRAASGALRRALVLAVLLAAAGAAADSAPGQADLRAGEAAANASPPHRFVAVPRSRWAVRVDGFVPDATALVEAAEPFGPVPKGGRQFALVYVTLENRGARKAKWLSGVTFYAGGRRQSLYDYRDACFGPKALDDLRDVPPRGRLSGTVCFSVRAADAATLTLIVEPASALPGTARVRLRLA
jgi:hypothetical protein